MNDRIFRIKDYLSQDEHIHAVRKVIDTRRPKYRHQHDYYELMIVLDGHIRHEVNDVSGTLTRGSAVFLRPHDLHLVHAYKGTEATIANLMFRLESIDHLSDLFGGDIGKRFFWTDAVLPEIRYLPYQSREYVLERINRIGDGRRTRLRAENILLHLLSDLLDAGDAEGANLPLWLASACRAAKEPAVFVQGAAGLVQVSGRSHEHVCRAMKRFLGVSPSVWVNQVRMDHAARLLGNDRLSVGEVSEACGIQNIGHFYRLFRGRHGTTPAAFRKRSHDAPV
ncbi:AraC family transcriptional regulator [Aestuariibius sp. 2305UL40-4]|uniref:helix-turn-helix transcriptional regulator n=1 Tax=Aestuariibius violaceus TaxID=3234132 RepID=UPI00345EA672